MCNHGDTVPVRVTIPAHLSHAGADREEEVQVDRCIAPLVEAINAANHDTSNPYSYARRTAGSCCGHGKGPAEIYLTNGALVRIDGDRVHIGDIILEIREGWYWRSRTSVYGPLPTREAAIADGLLAWAPVEFCDCTRLVYYGPNWERLTCVCETLPESGLPCNEGLCICGAAETESNGPRTTYVCGGSDYDGLNARCPVVDRDWCAMQEARR